MTKTKTEAAVTAADIGRLIMMRATSRNYARFTATLSEDGNALLVDVADPTGPNGQRSFIVEFTVREVT